jgi:hypothetical protein
MKHCTKALKKAKGEKEEYEMPKSKALHEHKRLIKVLKTKKGLKKEVEEQKKDLKDIKKK